VLSAAIGHVAALHPDCDLSHPGSPSAAVAITRVTDDGLEYLVLGDITLVMRTEDTLTVIVDNRVSATAAAERRRADRHPIGSVEKHDALRAMKYVELAARNRPGGYWIAAADPAVATRALTGRVPLTDVSRLAIMTDGAARLVDLFAAMTWTETLSLLDRAGPAEIIRRVRALESADPDGRRWPRNKRSDDATIVYARW
jgi:hypothetical protein